MWFPAPELLAKSTPANAFLVCRWNEFFDGQTPDSYRPRICHLPVLVIELEEVGDAVVKEDGLRKHLLQVKQECRARVEEETSFFKLCSAADLAVLNEIAAEATDDATVATKARQLRQSGFASRYESAALGRGQTELYQHLNRPRPGKRCAERWLGLWATIALHRGYMWSTVFLRRQEAMFERGLGENIAQIAHGLQQPPEEYVCVVAVTARPERHDQKPKDGDAPLATRRLKSAVSAAKIKLAHHSWLPDYQSNPNELLLVGNETGVGPVDALYKFARGLRPLFNLLGFYRGASPASPIRSGWAGLNRKELKAYEISALNPRQLYPRKNAVDLAVRGLRVARAGRLNGVLANALELHNMAISSPDLRVQFVTMWSALECLASTATGDSVISRVMNLLVPIVSWRRLEKEIRYLALNLRQWRETTGNEKTPWKPLPNATPDEVPGEDVLLTVTRPPDHSDMVELLGTVAGHPLLLWRTTTTWETFHDPAVLAKDLERARERLTWHIGRIYRVRNRLVHAGDDSPLLAALLDNLQFYLSTTISRLLHGVASNPKFNAAKAAAHWCALSDKVQSQLVAAPAMLTVADVISKPRLHVTQCPWGARV
jgi:hypothetical protein